MTRDKKYWTDRTTGISNWKMPSAFLIKNFCILLLKGSKHFIWPHPSCMKHAYLTRIVGILIPSPFLANVCWNNRFSLNIHNEYLLIYELRTVQLLSNLSYLDWKYQSGNERSQQSNFSLSTSLSIHIFSSLYFGYFSPNPLQLLFLFHTTTKLTWYTVVEVLLESTLTLTSTVLSHSLKIYRTWSSVTSSQRSTLMLINFFCRVQKSWG